MQGYTLGAGLAAFAFWGFIASVVVAGIWYDIRKREAQQETVRRLFESGQAVDEELLDKLLSAGGGTNDRIDRYLQLTGLILLPVAVGLAVLGMILGMQYEDSRLPLLGVSALVGCIGLGFLAAARIARRWYTPENSSGFNEV